MTPQGGIGPDLSGLKNLDLSNLKLDFRSLNSPRTREEISDVELKRLGTQEEQAQRAKLARDLMVQQQAAQRQLASQQARAGMRTGASAAQQARLAQQLEGERSRQEEQGQLGRTMFNLTQEQKEQFARVAKQLALKQMATALEGQKAMAAAAEKGAAIQAQATKEANQGGFLGTVICTELHRQGYLCDQLIEADDLFGKQMYRTNPDIMYGYWRLASPIVPLMKKSKAFTHFVAFFGKPWAHHMAYLMGVKKTDNLFGKVIMAVGKNLCLIAAKKEKIYG